MASPATAVRRAGAGMRLLRAAVFAAVCVVLAALGHELASGRTVPVWSLLLGWLGVFAFTAPLAGRERTLPGIASLLAAGQVTLHVVFGTGQMCGSVGTARATGAGTGTDGGLLAVAARLVCGSAAHGALTPQAAREVLARAGIGAMSSTPAMTSMPSMPSMPSTSSMPSMAAMHMASGASATGAIGSGGVGAGAGGGAGTAWNPGVLLGMCTLPMLLGHLLAALVAGWLLRRGEAALWRLVALSVRGAAGLAAFSPAVLRRARALLAALAGTAPCARVRARRAADAPAARPRTVRLRHSLARRGPPLLAAAV
ncbi:hypothetical protein V2S66_03975 [Streptomyces sp. V4-01]|uniref:Integral membrane protein n=1 Tax=Actinacidiphila polyblastidii TaxID=3110430 RepID=A0ABU7P5N9_9ACTN|nr:hypothetical protein [Streptomyces sp. V4-01]